MKRWLPRPARAFVLAPAMALVLSAQAHAQTTLNVRDADIRAFIADAAKVTGRTFIIDSRVQGKVTVVTDRPLSRSEYFEVFLSTLRANGLVTVPTANGALRVQPTENAAANPGRIGLAGAARNQFVTEIVRLRSIDAQSAVDTVRPLVSAQGAVSANRAGSSIVIADFADNVRRVREVLRRIDSDNNSTRVIALKNAGARDIATALQGLLGTPAQGQTATASVVAVEGANSIALRGDPSTVARLAQVATDLDQKAKSGTEIRVVFLEHADAAQLLPVLQQLVGQTPDSVPQNQLSQSNFGASTNGTGTSAGQPSVNTGNQTQTQNAPGGGSSGQAAVQAQGGRAPAVVTRFVGANAIVIAAPADIQRQLSEVVRQLDTRREQVLVEAVVAEVSDQTASRLGFQFLLGSLTGGAFGATSFSNSAPSLLTIAGAIGAREIGGTTTTVVGADGSRTTTTTGNAASDALAQQALNSILGAGGGFGGFGGDIGGGTILGTIINAVKADTTSNLLQAPSLITLDNQEARILVGQEIPITTGQALSQNFDNAFRTVQRENVGIQLEVRPQVNSSGSIKLFLHQQVSSIAGPVSDDNSDLILNKREVETTLTVDDGQIAIIGGLLSDDERRTLEKLPLLGDIPVLGNLFRSKARQRTKTNLMVFIRPTILRTPEDNRRVTEQRYGYLRLQQGQHNPTREPSIDELVRDYMGAAAPIPSAPVPGNIEDPRVNVPVQRNTTTTIRRRDQ